MYLSTVGTQSSVLINQVSLFQVCPERFYCMPVQTWEGTTFVREYQHILFGAGDWSMLSSPS